MSEQQAFEEMSASILRSFELLDSARLPINAVQEIHSWGFAEDGALVIMATLDDGRTCRISLQEGSPITVHTAA